MVDFKIIEGKLYEIKAIEVSPAELSAKISQLEDDKSIAAAELEEIEETLEKISQLELSEEYTDYEEDSEDDEEIVEEKTHSLI